MNNTETKTEALKDTNSSKRAIDIVNKGLKKRYRAERRFKLYGVSAIVASLTFLAILLISITGNGYTAFQQTFMKLDVFFDPDILDRENLETTDYPGLVKATLRKHFPDVTERLEKRALYSLASSGASFQLREMVLNNPDLIGKSEQIWVPADDDVDMFVKGHLDRNVPEPERRLKDNQLSWLDKLEEDGRIRKQFNTSFFSGGDSREPELAGIGGAFTRICALRAQCGRYQG